MSKHRAKLWHAVVVGRNPGIYQGHWDTPGGARAQVDKCSGAIYRGFDSFEEAYEFYVAMGKSEPRYIEWFQIPASLVTQERLSIFDGKAGQLEIHEHSSHDRLVQPKESVTHLNHAIDVATIGRWGEETAYRAISAQLAHKYGLDGSDLQVAARSGTIELWATGKQLATIHWHNSECESNDSPDITTIESSGETYWEVKTTTGDTFTINVTPHEKQFAANKGDRYHLLRVLHAGNSNTEIYDFGNPFSPKPVDIKVAEKELPLTSVTHRCSGFALFKSARDRSVCRVHALISPGGNGRLFVFRRVRGTMRSALYPIGGRNIYHSALAPLRSVKDVGQLDIEVYIRGDFNLCEQTIRLALQNALSTKT